MGNDFQKMDFFQLTMSSNDDKLAPVKIGCARY
jgi:hypothetical protein